MTAIMSLTALCPFSAALVYACTLTSRQFYEGTVKALYRQLVVQIHSEPAGKNVEAAVTIRPTHLKKCLESSDRVKSLAALATAIEVHQPDWRLDAEEMATCVSSLASATPGLRLSDMEVRHADDEEAFFAHLDGHYIDTQALDLRNAMHIKTFQIDTLFGPVVHLFPPALTDLVMDCSHTIYDSYEEILEQIASLLFDKEWQPYLKQLSMKTKKSTLNSGRCSTVRSQMAQRCSKRGIALRWT